MVKQFSSSESHNIFCRISIVRRFIWDACYSFQLSMVLCRNPIQLLITLNHENNDTHKTILIRCNVLNNYVWQFHYFNHLISLLFWFHLIKHWIKSQVINMNFNYKTWISWFYLFSFAYFKQTLSACWDNVSRTEEAINRVYETSCMKSCGKGIV